MSDIRSDTIKRSDAIKVVHDYWKQQLDRLPKVQGEYGEVLDGDCDSLLTHNKELSTRIKALPSADRPQGEWIEKIVDNVKITVCSNCDKEPTFTHYYGSCGNYSLSDFCPNCGVRMKGADDE